MKNISKLLVGILFSSLVMAPSFAGELSVTGGATATYTIGGDNAGAGKNLGISNEIDFSASGELDNGYTWNYQVQLDGASTANDDTKLTLGTDYGTIGFFVTEGGLSQELVHGVGALGVGFDYISPANGTAGAWQTGYDVSSYSNVQYHTPADLLPLGLQAKIGYVPDMNDTTQLSAKEDNGTNPSPHNTGRNLTMLTVSATPIDGLKVAADVAQTSEETGTPGTAGNGDEGISANVGAKYTMGQFSVGYTEGGYQPAVGDGSATVTYENKFYGAQFDINDQLSVSYNVDESDRSTRATTIVATAAGTTETRVAMEQESVQLAYTTGGATIGIAQVEVDNSDYTAGRTETQSVVSLGISF
jgi:hypothetical protein